ncbi:YheT family hydrolase [Paraburkholderia tagetis]|uniref:Alpha/beta fold hydrolase n=1 Tax=Paraburkholderia tagetis TaxID=2913261 RepID=A0A9X1UGD6_9BURK|nr:alpha/beta fold hydrolase [Paraburkholderia tagetis]MCG5072878.1 alpha/beta fold hydrolase [Paraburkholderia tagetis]
MSTTGDEAAISRTSDEAARHTAASFLNGANGYAQGGSTYRAPFWLPGAHIQTIVPALFSRLPLPAYRRERWDTPDGDFIELDWVDAPGWVPACPPRPSCPPCPPEGARRGSAPNAPLFVLFHGLEGSSGSHYARAFAAAAHARGWHAVIPHFRSCSGPMNLMPRFYHLADAAEVDWVLRRLAARHAGPLVAVGVSLGGNVLLHWLAQQREDARIVSAAVAVSAPLDVHAGGKMLANGFGMVYTRSFLKTLKVKALQKLEQYPGLFDAQAVLATRNMYEFDDVVTAPLHGFQSAHDYYTRATVRPKLGEIVVPTLLINARNDPFLPGDALPARHEVSAAVELEQPEDGGHVGFMTGPFPGRSDWLAQRVTRYLSPHVS